MPRRHKKLDSRSLKPAQHNASARSKVRRPKVPAGKRARAGERNVKLPFVPPEDWHEPTENSNGYRVVVQPPGPGYRHVLTAADIRARLSDLPDWMLADLEVVQLSRMTRKKQSFPCYGLQWGAALYLYPIEENLIEYYTAPPLPNQVNEARMYGGRWSQTSPGVWALAWTEQSVRDFYLNNILIHELGHLVDDRNSGYVDRERFAEWFAVEFGFRRTRASRAARKIVRRHHGSGARRMKRA